MPRPAALAQEESGAGEAEARPEQVRPLWEAHERAQRRHLWRVAAWGGANLAAGAALMIGARRATQRARFGFGLQSSLWGAINLGIAGFGLSGAPATRSGDLGRALESVRGYHDLLLLNMGLNVAYAGVGAAMLVAGYRDVRSAGVWRGHGAALVMQGVGLFVLDGLALWGARGRLDQLLSLTEAVTLSVGGAGVGLLVRL